MKLLFEAIIAAFLFWLTVSPLSPAKTIGFIGFIIWLFRTYFKHLPHLKSIWFSFLALVVLTWLIINPVNTDFIKPVGFIGLIIVIFVYAIAFFGFIGLADFLFKNNSAVYNFLNAFLMAVTFLIFFSMNFVWWRPIFLGFFLFMFFREFFNFYKVNWQKRSLIICLVLVLAGLELAAVVSFLPLGPFNAAAFLTLFFLLTRDIILAFFKGQLNLYVVFRQITIFVVFTIIIFAVSQWSL